MDEPQFCFIIAICSIFFLTQKLNKFRYHLMYAWPDETSLHPPLPPLLPPSHSPTSIMY